MWFVELSSWKNGPCIIKQSPVTRPGAKPLTETHFWKHSKHKAAYSEGLLDFEPESELPNYVPGSLPIPKPSGDMMKLPIYLKDQGKTIIVDCQYHAGAESKDYWKEVAKRVKAMKGTGFASQPPIEEHDIRQLEVSEPVIPRILGMDGRLQYHLETRYDRINKPHKDDLYNVNDKELLKSQSKNIEEEEEEEEPGVHELFEYGGTKDSLKPDD